MEMAYLNCVTGAMRRLTLAKFLVGSSGLESARFHQSSFGMDTVISVGFLLGVVQAARHERKPITAIFFAVIRNWNLAIGACGKVTSLDVTEK